jgi:hypothetical protein
MFGVCDSSGDLGLKRAGELNEIKRKGATFTVLE